MSLYFWLPAPALLLDRLFGEPPRLHPLVGFGRLADWLESRLNHRSIHYGILAWCLAVLPLSIAVWWLDTLLGGLWMSILCGWLAIGWQSLRQHAQWVEQALLADDLPQARQKVGWLVSRDTSQLDETAVSRACIESVLENGSDAVFAPLFWLIIGGAPAVVLYRLSNTLDAMWGYRTERFERFGKWAARVDDVLNWIPARLTALTYALCGSFAAAMQAWRTQGSRWYSPNAGVVMAAGAGALQVQLGGDAVYAGQTKSRPSLGAGAIPDAHTITRAMRLLDRGVYLWAGFTLIMGVGSVFLT
ncbi:adenosylcobinamide-phosphate synthase CbiB [Thiothrix winogradskyi]|uniref:Cobalamin biosynthesis protein CobD n=1 Tax=Thiothrix winogradskyi TaxID=96472 RepID=A0ABY3T149_9GAMM|nr:adenosylcobinamide-phosphate synthase CbiB [Thiothrix winogradskyi]UJS24491.1 adenosylcobinamide-phosphate synthase CbiB [Thiothrix winogradskyi]